MFLISRRGKKLYFQAQMSGRGDELQDNDEQIDAAGGIEDGGIDMNSFYNLDNAQRG